jgi:hypothetical protein
VSHEDAVLARGLLELLRDDTAWQRCAGAQQAYMQGRFSLEAMQQALRLGMAVEHRARPRSAPALP